MLTGLWRTGLIKWLEEFLVVDAYSDSEPELNKTNGFIPPLTNITFKRESDNLIRATATQEVQIMHHLPASKYRDLPLALYESRYSTLSYHALLLASEIAPVISLEALTVDTPIQVSHYGKSEDWLILYTWRYEVSWYVDPLVPLAEDYNITRVTLNLYNDRYEDDLKDGRDPSLSVLDFTQDMTTVSDPIVVADNGLVLGLGRE